MCVCVCSMSVFSFLIFFSLPCPPFFSITSFHYIYMLFFSLSFSLNPLFFSLSVHSSVIPFSHVYCLHFPSLLSPNDKISPSPSYIPFTSLFPLPLPSSFPSTCSRGSSKKTEHGRISCRSQQVTCDTCCMTHLQTHTLALSLSVSVNIPGLGERKTERFVS